MFDAIRAYQREHGLKVDGVLQPGGETEVSLRTLQSRSLKAQAEALRTKGRFGDTILAHISPAEARLLDGVTDGGSINPETGLLEFWDQGQGGGGIVHVDAYIQDRNGTSTSVSSYTRSAPGAGSIERPNYAYPVQNPHMRNDIEGKGYFGAPRGNRTHNGVDIEATPGQSINAPVSGIVIRNNVDPYGNGQFGGVLIRADDGSEVKVMYVNPTVKVGDRVEAGKSPVGMAQDVRDRHGPKMTPHIHIEGKQNGQYYDVTPYVLPGGKTKP